MRIILSLLLFTAGATTGFAAERQTNTSPGQKLLLAAPSNLRVISDSSACTRMGLLGDSRWNASSVPLYSDTPNVKLPPTPYGQSDCASAFKNTYALLQWDWDAASCANSATTHCVPSESFWIVRSTPAQPMSFVPIVAGSSDMRAAGAKVAVMWRKEFTTCVVVMAGANAQIQDSFGGPVLVPKQTSAPTNQACMTLPSKARTGF
jgi:hypothetical protein